MSERVEVVTVVRAYLLARDAFGLPEIWGSVEALDNHIAAATQIRMLVTLSLALAKAMDRLLGNREALSELTASIDANRKGLIRLGEWLETQGDALDPAYHRAEKSWQDAAVPAELAQRVARLPVLVGAFDLIGLATKNKMRVSDLAAIFFSFEKRLDLGWLGQLALTSTLLPWQREAVQASLDKLAAHHRRLTAQLADKKAKGKTKDVAQWAALNASKLERYDTMLSEWRAAGTVDLAMLLLANECLGMLSA
jgi:glutamate dehydrogenase